MTKEDEENCMCLPDAESLTSQAVFHSELQEEDTKDTKKDNRDFDEAFNDVEAFLSHANDPATLAKERALFKEDKRENIARKLSAEHEVPFEDVEEFLSKLDEKRVLMDDISERSKRSESKEVFPGAYRVSGVDSDDNDDDVMEYHGQFEKPFHDENQENSDKDSLEAPITASCTLSEPSDIPFSCAVAEPVATSKKISKMKTILLFSVVLIIATGLTIGIAIKPGEKTTTSIEQCEYSVFEKFSTAWKRCLCNETLEGFSEDHIFLFNALQEDFQHREFKHNITSCELPNIALHWLVEDSLRLGTNINDNLSDRYAVALSLLSWTKNITIEKWANNDREGWMTERTVCDWSGITCNENGEVTHIVLEDNQLSGEIPSEISALSSLEVLNLDGNFITGSIPTELGRLAAATKISLKENQIKGSIPNEFGLLTKLKQIYLSRNQITGVLPTSIGSCTSLQELELAFNSLSGNIPTEIGHLTKLESLKLMRNSHLNGSIPSNIASCTALREISMWDCRISGSLPTELGALSSLEKIEVNRNQLEGSIPSTIFYLPHLRSVDLSQNLLNSSIPKFIELKETQLEELLLGHNFISGEIPTELGLLSNLVTIQLSQNLLQGSIPSQFGSCSKLEDINVSSNRRVRGTIPTEIGDLTRLSYFDFSQTSIEGTLPEKICDLPNVTTLAADCFQSFKCDCCTRCY
mmetsp:Transcript_32921/g.49703  ORF Transcript_32921/g.49703 Transcript_32921/m.49703 type:complete len:697 (+) Transcript_32921:122-2212(+)|eukprot:CAMPEP_0178914468 /NCGR_PEP_ID=MMETSP0786-20121207/11443_1 /TAXON_ID=186022 /ORGANISM="Thalassionema frauenfeldii, Strain CCMP 1798" /LENGTH=696 /DNA_ID=CAMNT_0020587381 /DNA_START=82 /DNA_END=2172 /DNA_ORIENTATION=-